MCEGIVQAFTSATSGLKDSFSGPNLILASGAMKAVGDMVQGHQAGKYLEYQSAQALADAHAEREIGQVRATQVRKAGALVSSEATAAQGASGSSVNSGSALAVREYIDRSSGSDAMMELYGGAARARSREATAAGYTAQAERTRADAFGAAGGSLLASAGYARQLEQQNDKWLRRQQDMALMYPNQFSVDDPRYGG